MAKVINVEHSRYQPMSPRWANGFFFSFLFFGHIMRQRRKTRCVILRGMLDQLTPKRRYLNKTCTSLGWVLDHHNIRIESNVGYYIYNLSCEVHEQIVIIIIILALLNLLCYWESILTDFMHGPRRHFQFNMDGGRLFEAHGPIDIFQVHSLIVAIDYFQADLQPGCALRIALVNGKCDLWSYFHPTLWCCYASIILEFNNM